MTSVSRTYSLFFLPAFLFVLQTSFAAGYYDDGPYVDADVSVRYEDNLSRANRGADIEEDMVTAFSVGAGYLKKLDDKSQLLASAYLVHERFSEFSDLNNFAVNAGINYTLQPKPGYTSPWYELSVNLAKLQFKESDIRDSYVLNTKLAAGKRFTDRIISKLAYSYERRYSDGDVFNTDTHALDLSFIYSYSKSVAIFGNYKAMLGEVVSTARANQVILAASERVSPDDVFAAGVGPGCANRRCAYRLDAVSQHFEAGLEIRLNQLASFDLSSRYFLVDANKLEAYKGWVYGASIYLQY